MVKCCWNQLFKKRIRTLKAFMLAANLSYFIRTMANKNRPTYNRPYQMLYRTGEAMYSAPALKATNRIWFRYNKFNQVKFLGRRDILTIITKLRSKKQCFKLHLFIDKLNLHLLFFLKKFFSS